MKGFWNRLVLTFLICVAFLNTAFAITAVQEKWTNKDILCDITCTAGIAPLCGIYSTCGLAPGACTKVTCSAQATDTNCHCYVRGDF